jgi:hypothetical protein
MQEQAYARLCKTDPLGTGEGNANQSRAGQTPVSLTSWILFLDAVTAPVMDVVRSGEATVKEAMAGEQKSILVVVLLLAVNAAFGFAIYTLHYVKRKDHPMTLMLIRSMRW